MTPGEYEGLIDGSGAVIATEGQITRDAGRVALKLELEILMVPAEPVAKLMTTIDSHVVD